jgi:alkylation response protein AidB-like acyl-CoA dehydrogenase
MDFQLNEEQRALADSVTRLLQDHYDFDKRRAIAAGDGWAPALWRSLVDLGLTALGIPEDCGGLGGGNVDRLPVMKAFGAALVLEPYLGCVLGATAVREAGSAAQRQEMLPAVAAGELLPAWAHDEAGGRHSADWVETVARREGGEWRLNGAKCLVLHAAAASAIIVSARVGAQGADPGPIAFFLVDPGATGASLRHYRLVDDRTAGELVLRDAVGHPLGDPDDTAHAVRALRAVQAAGTAAACAEMVGAMETAFSLTTEYVKVRKQFGRPIGEFQVLRHRIADMFVDLEVARSMAVAAAVAADDPASAGAQLDLRRAKLVIGRRARTLCQAAIQVHGGIGMSAEYPVGHCLRRIHVLDHLFGDVDAQISQLAFPASNP